jgi:capsule polysaccharide export protein KpsE/RkpR
MFPKVIKIKKNGLHKDEISLQYRIFNKTEDLRKYWEEKLGVEFDDSMEVWQGFIEENETLEIDKIKEYV